MSDDDRPGERDSSTEYVPYQVTSSSVSSPRSPSQADELERLTATTKVVDPLDEAFKADEVATSRSEEFQDPESFLIRSDSATTSDWYKEADI